MCYKVLILFVITILLGNPFCWVLPNCPKNSMKCEIHLWIWGEFRRKNISFKKNWIKKENNHTNSNLTLNSFENISISLSWRVRELTKICQFIPFMILINYLFIFFSYWNWQWVVQSAIHSIQFYYVLEFIQILFIDNWAHWAAHNVLYYVQWAHWLYRIMTSIMYVSV